MSWAACRCQPSGGGISSRLSGIDSSCAYREERSSSGGMRSHSSSSRPGLPTA